MVLESLSLAVGTSLRRVRRIRYVFDGQADTDFGPIQLTFGKQPFLFNNESDGESLRITKSAWVDPFAGPLNVENEEFVARSGKWTAFDVSEDRAWSGLIDEVLIGVEPIISSVGKISGVVLRTEHGGVLRLGVMADELFVDDLVAPD